MTYIVMAVAKRIESPVVSQAGHCSQGVSNLLYQAGHTREIELQEDQDQDSSCNGKKRQRNPDNWSKKHQKRSGLRKNAPLIEISSDMSCCKKKCLQRFSTSHLQNVRSSFQDLFYEQQNIYLNGLLHCKATKKSSGHSRKANPSVSSTGKRLGRPPAEESTFRFQYTLRNESGVNIPVCQKSFCTVLGFGPKRLQVLRRKLGSGSLEPDKRGKHGNHSKVGEEIKALIREHIASYPTRHSHYSRKDNSGRVYLPAELSVARLYRNFLEKYDPEYIKLEKDNHQHKMCHEPTQNIRKPLVSEHLYRDLFTSEFNIHFGYPRTDSCSTCDSLAVQIQAAGDMEKPQLEKDLKAHQKLAQEGYNAFHYDRELSKTSWTNIATQN